MKFTKIAGVLLSTLIIGGLSACTDEVKYDPTPKYDGDEVYFPNTNATTIDVKQGATEVYFTVARVSDEKDLTVSFESTVVDGAGNAVANVFDVPAAVTFAAGEKTVSVPVGVTFSNIVAEEQYVLTVSIAGESLSPYGATTTSMVLSYAPWSDFTRMGGNADFGTYTLSAFGIEDEVAVYKSNSLIDNRVRYQFGDYDCPELNSNKNDWSWIVNGYNATLNFDPTTKIVTMDVMPTGDEGSFGEMLYVTDIYTYVKDVNPAAAGGEDPMGWAHVSSFNEQTGLFSIKMVYYISSKYVAITDEYFQLPGYASYEIIFEQMGNFVTNKGEAVVLSAYKSDDIYGYGYKLVQGALTDATAAAVYDEIKNDESLVLTTESLSYLSFTLAEEGPYTVVAVGFDDKMTAVYETYFTFTFSSVQKESDFEELGWASYTDGFLYQQYNGIGGETWDVKVEVKKDNDKIIRVVNPYNSEYWPNGYEGWDMEGNYYLTFNMENPDRVYMETTELGVTLSANDGSITVSSLAGFYLEGGNDADAIASKGFFGKLEDGVITFPGRTLLISWANVNDGAFYYTNFVPGIAPNTQTTPMPQAGAFELDLSGLMKTRPAKAAASNKGAGEVRRSGNSIEAGVGASSTGFKGTAIKGTIENLTKISQGLR